MPELRAIVYSEGACRSSAPCLAEQIQLRRRGKGFELFAVLLAAGALADGAFGGEFAVFQVAEDYFGALQHFLGHAGQTRDVIKLEVSTCSNSS